jgi:peptide/nickel transport system substrate-binding protein
MENRFGIKDLFLFLLIGGLIVVVVLAMVQFDRQFDQVRAIRDKQDELTRDVIAIRNQLAQGVVAVGATPTTGAATQAAKGDDVFKGLREAEKKGDFARGDWFIDSFGTKIGRLTPHVSSDVYQKWVEYQVMESLTVTDPYTLEPAPRLATHWEISPDGLVMRFHLRRGATFSDGEPVTADDVIFSFDLVRNPAYNAARTRAYLTKLKDVKKIDDYTVEFTFSEFYYGNFDYAAGVDVPVMPKHFYSKFTPDQFNEKTGLLMGSGPYKLQSPDGWTPGQPIELVRNDRYWGTPATFDRIVYREIENESTEMVMFGNQELDQVHCTPDVFKRMTEDKRLTSVGTPIAYTSPFRGYSYCGWNQRRNRNGREEPTFFADKRVRQAMTMLLDRERICREINYGLATVASGPFAVGTGQSDPDVKPWPYDVERAKSLLREAGFQDRDGDGVIESPDGKPFRFKVTYPSGVGIWDKVVLFMKDAYARAGIVAEPDRIDWPVLVNRLNTSDFDAICLSWSTTPESDPYQIFHSSQIKDQGDNRTGYNSPECDAAIEKARTTVDKDERMKGWHKVHQILHEDQPYTFISNRKELRFFNNRVKNIELSKIGLNYEDLNGGMIPWYVPRNQQRYSAK